MRTWARLVVMSTALALPGLLIGCSTGATRVDCSRRLEPINTSPPVTHDAVRPQDDRTDVRREPG